MAVIQLKLENINLIFIALDLSYANNACAFCSKECVINISVKMYKTNLLTSMQITKRIQDALSFSFACHADTAEHTFKHVACHVQVM